MERRINVSGWASLLILLFVLHACETSEEQPNPLDINQVKPVDRSFKQIQEEGVIRLITRFNSLTYFLHQGVEQGFEYELVKAFADQYDLNVEVIIAGEDRNPIELLNSGEGDLIAANYSITNERKQYISFTQPYNVVNQVAVIHEMDTTNITSLSDLEGQEITVRRNSSYHHKLRELQNSGIEIEVNTVSQDWDTEAIMMSVSEGEFNATVADDNLFYAASTYIDNIAAGPVISESDSVAWAIRSNNPDLKTAMNRFLSKQFRIADDGEIKRSALLNILVKKYFTNQKNANTYRTQIYDTKYSGVLSPYDKLIRPLADSAGIDWKMVVSIAAQESRFDPMAKSWAGAIGLMQINHRFSKYSEEELYDPEINVREGLRILKNQLKHYDYLDSTQVWPFVLATYNAGVGHVSDARRVAIDHYKDPNAWPNLKDGLLKLMKRKYYSKARYGFCRGVEPVNYVREVINRREMYQTIMEISQKSAAQGIPAVMGVGQQQIFR